ncbi:MAG: hypothetical protein NC187_06305 [Candidatus Amulumruptor caecigallinarius]|nr:hypothetical protein [Candidatus Amulumruptor caecigallinarius]MCM1397082.1 hypothetical protein [Candidatus Amulumruptor caecigallinarius]MCM1454068.1 hypothetical protein [bacterium]
MTNEEKALIKGKKVEAIIALFLLITPILGVISFVLCLCDNNGAFAKMSDLSSHWTGSYGYDGGGYTSAAPIYLGLMAIAGVLLLKDSFRYLFLKDDEEKKTPQQNYMNGNFTDKTEVSLTE